MNRHLVISNNHFCIRNRSVWIEQFTSVITNSTEYLFVITMKLYKKTYVMYFLIKATIYLEKKSKFMITNPVNPKQTAIFE